MPSESIGAGEPGARGGFVGFLSGRVGSVQVQAARRTGMTRCRNPVASAMPRVMIGRRGPPIRPACSSRRPHSGCSLETDRRPCPRCARGTGPSNVQGALRGCRSLAVHGPEASRRTPGDAGRVSPRDPIDCEPTAATEYLAWPGGDAGAGMIVRVDRRHHQVPSPAVGSLSSGLRRARHRPGDQRRGGHRPGRPTDTRRNIVAPFHVKRRGRPRCSLSLSPSSPPRCSARGDVVDTGA